MMQVDFGDGKPWRRGDGRARGVWVTRALIMVGSMMTGGIWLKNVKIKNQ